MSDFTLNHLFIRKVPEVQNPRFAEPLAEEADLLEGFLNNYRTREAKILRDPGLTNTGRSKAVRRSQEAAREALPEATAEPVGLLKKRLGWAEKLLERRTMILPGEGPMEDVLEKEKEIRDLARTLRPEDVVDRYLECCRAADTVAVRAFENAPPSFPLLTPEQIAEGAEIHAQARFPEEYEELVQARAAINHAEWNMRRALAEFRPPPPTPQELVEAAQAASQ